jgi:SWI/SNF-related matrix-associated actin-dependent regulator 1 of chromatin subfamily A
MLLFLPVLHVQDVPDGVNPLSHLLLPLGVDALKPLLDTQVPSVLTDTETLWGNNLLHAAAGLAEFGPRLAAVEAIANAAAQLGLLQVFTAQNGSKKLASSVCKNVKIKQAIAFAEKAAKAKQAEAKRREEQQAKAAAAAEAAEAAKKAAAQQKAREEQAIAEAAAAAAAAAAKEIAAAEAEVAAAAAAAPGSPLRGTKRAAAAAPETDARKKARLQKLMAIIPRALQAAAFPASEVLAAAEAAAAVAGAESAVARQLNSAARMARDNAIIQQRIQEVAPEQPAGAAAAEGVQADGQQLAAAAAAAAAGDGQQPPSVADAAARAVEELNEDDMEEQPAEGTDVSGGTASGQPGAAAEGGAFDADAETADVDESCLTGLPWEFTISKEALVAWMRLDK